LYGSLIAAQRQKERKERMNTRKVEDRQERKKLKREARKKAPGKAKRTEPRGSNKPKLKKKGAAKTGRR
jgi:hypothetical protein